MLTQPMSSTDGHGRQQHSQAGRRASRDLLAQRDHNGAKIGTGERLRDRGLRAVDLLKRHRR